MNPIPEEDEITIYTEESAKIEKKGTKNNIEEIKDSFVSSNNNSEYTIESNKNKIIEENNNNKNVNKNLIKNEDSLNNNINKKQDKKGIKKLDYKIILLGDFSVGKSSIIAHFVDNNYQKVKNQKKGKNKFKTIAIDNDSIAKLELYDTFGEEKFSDSLPNQFYKDAYGAIIVYDISNKKSFNKIEFWLNEINNKCPSDIIILIIGNKLDIKERIISYEEGNLLAKKYNIDYFETSAKTGNNITLIFEKILFEIIKKQNENEKNGTIVERSLLRKSIKLTEKNNNENFKHNEKNNNKNNNNNNNINQSKCKC